jgi:hypothetical protein
MANKKMLAKIMVNMIIIMQKIGISSSGRQALLPKKKMKRNKTRILEKMFRRMLRYGLRMNRLK